MKTLSMQEKLTAFLVKPVRMEDSTDYVAPQTGHDPVASGKLTLVTQQVAQVERLTNG